MAIRLLGASGKGIKKYNIIVDASQHYILLPVVPGMKNKVEPEFIFAEETSVTKLSPIDENNHVKYLFDNGREREEWIAAVMEWGNAITGELGYFADAEIEIFDGRYYIYPTTDGFEGWGGHYFKALSSPDLVHWKDEGVILDLKSDISWSDGNAWAPCIVKKNGKYYYYFSANTDKMEPESGKAVGVAVSDTPCGRFKDPIGKPIVYNGMEITDEYGEKKVMHYPGQVIDPAVFTDPETGKSYLYWGNGSMWVCELGDDMVSLNGEPKNITPPNFREGTHVFYRKGIYYFTWAEDDTRSKNYHVRWGFAPGPEGPVVGNYVMLEKNEEIGVYGTGHHTVVNIPGTDRWYICYHRFNFPARFEGDESDYYGTHRELAIDSFGFDEEGKIIKANPTLEGVTDGEEFCSYAKIKWHTPLSGVDEGDDIQGFVEVQSGECFTELKVIMELYDYQSNLIATASDKVTVKPFSTETVGLTVMAPERMRGHYLEFFTDDMNEFTRITY